MEGVKQFREKTANIESLQHAVVQAKVKGSSDLRILNEFVQQGFKSSEVISTLAGSFDYVAEQNSRLALQLDRYEQLFSIFSTLAAADESDLNCCNRFPKSRFFNDYYAKNKPLVIRGAAKRTCAYKKWTTEYLCNEFGEVMIQAAIGRDQYSDPEGNLSKIEKKIKLRDFLHLIDGLDSNDAYMVARNYNFMNPGLSSLLQDLQPLPACIKKLPSRRETHLWIGPKGTVTPFHYDRRNIFFFQISGVKRFILASPVAAPYIYNQYSVFSKVDPEHPDYKKYPLFRNVRLYTVDLQEGDALFLPVAWWHKVRSLTQSISVGTSDFIYKNEF